MEKIGWNLFVDDWRKPIDAAKYMYSKIGIDNRFYTTENWTIVKNYEQFVKTIKEKGIPKLVSFDFDLEESHYGIDFKEWEFNSSEQLGVAETGADCAKWLVEYCKKQNRPLCKYLIHSANPIGRKCILKELTN